MAIVPPEIVSRFRDHFVTHANPTVARAPGRVNLIGEHTDYNLGYVMPIALEMACYVAVAPSGTSALQVYSQDFDLQFSIPVDSVLNAQPTGKWHDYVVGVARELLRAGVALTGADLYIKSFVPTGSGLSSSAALEVSTAYALLGLAQLGGPEKSETHMDPLAIALLGQRAESQFVGMPCGIMDQYASVFGREGAAIQIDCRSLEHQYVTLPPNVAVIAVNSMVKHELGSSAYRERVAECQQAVEALQKTDSSITSLRDASVEFFTRVQETVPPLPRQRARHVITEIQRVVDFAHAAAKDDLAEMARLFVASHRSMQYDYEISCEEIDFLVDTAFTIPGVYGSRMTGGGFGGCTVNLVAAHAVSDFEHAIHDAYSTKYGIEPVFYDCRPAAQAGLIR